MESPQLADGLYLKTSADAYRASNGFGALAATLLIPVIIRCGAIGESGGAGGPLGNVGKSKFSSSDPGLNELIAKIESRYPGLIQAVNERVYGANGKIITDYDIRLSNAIIQYKTGSGEGIIGQILRTEGTTDLPVLGLEAIPKLWGTGLLTGLLTGL